MVTAPPASQELLHSKCGTVSGRWVETVFQDSEGRLWVHIAYLTEKHGKFIAPISWSNWVNKPCPDLPQSVSNGMIHTVKVPPPEGMGWHGGKWMRVWLLSDVDQVVRRWTDPAARETDPDCRGQWDGCETFVLTRNMGPLDPPSAQGLLAGDVLYRDDKMAGFAGVSDRTVVEWRRKGHPALDPAVYGGRLRHLWVCLPSEPGRGGLRMVPVSAKKDASTIKQYRLAVKDKQAKGTPGDGLRLRDLARELGRDPDDAAGYSALMVVAQAFAREVPEAAPKRERWDEGHERPHRPRYYNVAAFRRWLGRRNIDDLARELRRAEWKRRAPVSGRHLRRAVAFLQFILTQGRFGPRLFRRFLVKPPYGQTLHPCGFMPLSQIKAWAKLAHVPLDALRAAQQRLPIESAQLGPRHEGHWRLTTPVVLRRTEGDEGTYPLPAGRGKYPGHEKLPCRSNNAPDEETGACADSGSQLSRCCQ